MRECVDIESWKRRDVFNFFKGFVNPQFSISAEVACTGAYYRAKESGKSFFLHYLYAILSAVNEIDEFKYRVEQEGDSQDIVIYKYDTINVTTPITVGENGEYVEIYLIYNRDFNTFYKNASEAIANASSNRKPFDQNSSNGKGLCCVSALPTLRFTSITLTLATVGAVNMIPLISVGKMLERDGVRTIPISLQIHHGLADGKHASDFFAFVERMLNR